MRHPTGHGAVEVALSERELDVPGRDGRGVLDLDRRRVLPGFGILAPAGGGGGARQPERTTERTTDDDVPCEFERAHESGSWASRDGDAVPGW